MIYAKKNGCLIPAITGQASRIAWCICCGRKNPIVYSRPTLVQNLPSRASGKFQIDIEIDTIMGVKFQPKLDRQRAYEVIAVLV